MDRLTEDDSREGRLDEVIASYLDDVARGRAPTHLELLARHPDLAAELEQFFADRDRFDRLALPLRSAVGNGPPADVANTLSFTQEAPRTPPDTVAPVVEGYEVLEELGHGGMGIVYRARQKGLNRLVALKVMKAGAGATPQDLARFRAEAEAVARLRHPNIIQIHEVGEQGGLPFFCLELVEGGNLRQRLAGSPLAARPAAALVETVARAVHHAHREDIIHRDLKPANILLAGGPDTPVEQCVPKVADFGLAKRLDAEGSWTRTGEIVGTPSYMAPEQASGRGNRVGPAADVYALGALLYELLTGRPPFKAPTALDTVLQVLSDEPPPPSRLQPSVPRDLETVCLKCLHKEPAKRYPSAETLAEDLRRFQAGEPIRARPAGIWERSVKWTRRHPAVAALVAVCSLATLSAVAAVVGHNAHLRMNVAQAREELASTIREKQQTEKRAKSQPLLEQAEAEVARRESDAAAALVDKARDRIGDDPALADLRGEADRLLKEITSLRAAGKDRDELLRQRDEARFQLHRHLFPGADVPGSLAVARRTARAALDLFGVATEGEAGPDLDHRFSETEKDEIRQTCYDLLLMVAETAARPGRGGVTPPLPGKGGARVNREEVEKAIRILDRANQLVPGNKNYHLRRAAYLTLLGEEAKAAKERATAARLQPAGPSDAFLVGLDRWLEEPEEGRRYFDFALRDQPDHFWARFFLAISHIRSGRPAEAKAGLMICIRQEPDFIWSYLIRGFIHGELGEFKEAEADFDRARELNARKPDASARYVIHVNRGAMRVRQRRYEDAIDELKTAIPLQPDLFHAHLNLAQAYKERARRDETARQLATALQPNRLAARLALAAPNREIWNEALTQCTEAIGRQQTWAALYRERALVHALRQDPDAALRDYRRAIWLEPRGASAHKDHLECGLILYRQKKYDESVRACDAALRLRPAYALAHRLHAETLLQQGKYREALRSFDNYLRYAPGSADIFVVRARIRYELGQRDAVVTEYTSALARRPEDAALHARLGWAYLANYAPRPARHHFEEAVRRDPNNGDAHNGLGYALVKLGRPADGVRQARKALKLGPPEDPRTYYNAARVLARAAAAFQPRAGQYNSGGWALSDSYRDQAVQHLARALALLDGDEKRVEFWWKYVRPDSAGRDLALYPLRGHPRFDGLAARYDRPIRPTAGEPGRPAGGAK